MTAHFDRKISFLTLSTSNRHIFSTLSQRSTTKPLFHPSQILMPFFYSHQH